MPSTSSESDRSVLLATLDHYAESLCEGWCERSWDCARFFEECGGCLARRVAGEARAAISRAEGRP